MADLKQTIENDDHIAGPISAPISFVVYGNYTSPDAKSAYTSLYRIEEEEDIEDVVQYVIRHFFSDEDNNITRIASRAVEAASLQDKFWEMHAALISFPRELTEKSIRQIAKKIGLDMERFNHDLQDNSVQERIDQDITGAAASRVATVPTIFLNEKLYEGSYQKNDLLQEIDHYAHTSDLKDHPIISTNRNKALDYDRSDPLAYEIDPMPLEDEGYIRDEEGEHRLYKQLAERPGITLDEYDQSISDDVEDQDHSDPEPS